MEKRIRERAKKVHVLRTNAQYKRQLRFQLLSRGLLSVTHQRPERPEQRLRRDFWCENNGADLIMARGFLLQETATRR